MNQNVWNDFIALFYPNICLICDKPVIETEKFICVTCFLSMSRVQRETSGENDLLSKFAAFPKVTLARSFLEFHRNGPAQQLVHAFKYEDQKMLAHFLGKLMASDSKSLFEDHHWDFIIPVPLHSSRQQSRGYNQAEMLANGFGEELDIPVLNDQVLRSKQTKTQTGKNKLARWQSTSNMYELTENFCLQSKRVILIDDVVTTGATISGLIELMEESGVAEIGVVSLASE